MPGALTPTVHQLKIGLQGAAPPLWRRIQVPSVASLGFLHDVIRVAFGWEGYHLHRFNDAVLAGVGADGLGEPRLGTVASMLARAESRNVAVSRARPSSMTRFPGPSGASRRAATWPGPGLGVLS